MPYYVYILQCIDGSFYTGYTKNVDQRMRQHSCGKGARYTRMHKPQEVVYIELLDSRALAMRREKAIKKLSREQKHDLAYQRKTNGSPENKNKSYRSA